MPEKQEKYINNNLIEYYPENISFQWGFCRYFWESHPELPTINLNALNEIINIIHVRKPDFILLQETILN